MTKKFSLSNLFPGFHSSSITNEELEKIIKDAVKKEYPNDNIKEMNYSENGVEIVLDGGDIIEIDVDWQEIILA